ncbi:Gfo/Idh/MocA family protein [Radiobacillus sp. PE A8.2]|uniref:Gfo/Idh/MocA family protein n=1 Tax=Radiobacillus sp. PE A8.2 TaxID=3380349 RepID=UPI00388F8858
MLKIAIIGLGDVSKVHIPAIQNNINAKLVAVCDIDKSLKDTVDQTTFYSDYKTMLKMESLDCVHICLPHHLHYPVAKACVESGAHVLLEKPIASSVKDGLSLVELEQKNKDIKIGVSFQNRLNETFLKLQELIASGAYGEVLGIKGIVTWCRPKSYYDMKPWRGKMNEAGGGVMINQSIHTLDYMQLIGGNISSIRGTVDNLIENGHEVEDTAVAHIRFQSGATGLFFATTTNAINSSVEFQVVLEKGKLTIKDNILTTVNETGNKEKIVEDSRLDGSKFYYGASHTKIIDQFYQCIINDKQNYVHVKEGQITMQMIDAIYRSSAQKSLVEWR